jgi:cysteine desulfurase/selenocysteine lyase
MNLDDIHHYDAAMLLDHMGIIIRSGMHCSQPLMDRLGITGTIRASLALYNTKDDIDRFIKGLKKVQEVHGAT